MTQIGEGVWVTVPKPDQNKEQHNAALQVCYPNGKPYYTPTPLLISAKINGGPQDCAPNLERVSQLSWLEPGSQVSFNIEEHIEEEVSAARNEIKKTLDGILKLERDEQKRQDELLAEEGIFTRSIILTGAFMEGVGEGALSLVEFAGDAAVFAGKAAWLNAQVSFVNVLETAWDADYKQGNVKDFFQKVQGKNEADFAKAFGVTPQQLAASFAKAYEFFNFVIEDDPTKTMLLQFAKDYAFAQSKVEVAQMAGQAAFDIILSAILAFFTGGTGNVAQAVAKVKHLGQFRTLAGQLIKLVGKLKRLKAKKVVKGTLDGRVKHTVTPPAKNTLKPKKNTGLKEKTKNEKKYEKTKDDKKPARSKPAKVKTNALKMAEAVATPQIQKAHQVKTKMGKTHPAKIMCVPAANRSAWSLAKNYYSSPILN
ncbi:MAG TPA: hypothetical protein VIZ65_11495 [Cellvibrionaceae bacterium]